MKARSIHLARNEGGKLPRRAKRHVPQRRIPSANLYTDEKSQARIRSAYYAHFHSPSLTSLKSCHVAQRLWTVAASDGNLKLNWSSRRGGICNVYPACAE